MADLAPTQATVAVFQFRCIENKNRRSPSTQQVGKCVHFGKQRLGIQLVVNDRDNACLGRSHHPAGRAGTTQEGASPAWRVPIPRSRR